MVENHGNDFNLVVLCGQLAVEPEYRAFGSGARLIRYLITTRSSEPLRRVDNVPVVQWDPPDEVWDRELRRLDRVMIVGTVQRRIRIVASGRVSQTEIVATRVVLRDTGAAAA